MNALSPARHPWLAALRADPGDALQAAIAGTADLSPWGRAEPQDAIAAVLHGVPRADPAWAALDEGCRQALAELRDRLLRAASEPAFHLALIRSERLLAVIGRLQQGETVADLHRRYPWWLAGFESGVVPDGVDLRAAYLRLLALTQEIAPGAPARLMPLWLDLCAESGEAGRYPAEYLAIGLLGLRRMRLAPGQSAQEEAACHGLARWAARQRPTRETFLARWGEIEHAFPRAFDFWPPLVERVLAQAEGGMSTQGGFPAADWWREELELDRPRAGAVRVPRRAGRGVVEPPAPAEREDILRRAGDPLDALRPRIERLIAAHRRYADATGDTFYLVRTASNVGMRLLEHGTADGVERGLLAESLARLVLLHEPADQHAWGLRGDALAAAGRRDAAEALGWERLRRFPENPQWTGQLATLLAEGRGRPREAIALLDTGLALFPSHVTLRPHLGRLLADVADDTARARRLLEDQLARFPESRHAYGELAALLADRLGDTRGAEQVLRDELRRWPDDRLGRYYLERLHAGKRLRRRRDLPPAEEVLADPGGDVPLSLAAARRALFRLELDGHTDEARTALRHASDADPGLLYLHYAAERAGAVEPAAWRDTAFGFAFDRAARAGSAAAFHALARQWPNAVERRLIGHAIGLFSEMVNDPAPTVAAEARGGTPARLAALDAVLRGGDASARLMLLRDFAASDLSLQPIAA